MKNHDKTWTRLASLARRAPAEETGEAPPGFATRVVAQAFDPRRRPEEFMFRYVLRALGVAAALAIVCVVTNLNVFSADPVAGEDPVGELITQL